MPARFSWIEFAKHVFSWRLLLFFAVLKGVMLLVEKNALVERATLPGVDIAMMMTTRDDTARRTVVIGITSEDVRSRFANTRPIPPVSLLRAVDSLTQLNPAALVVDVFTEDLAYAKDTSDWAAAIAKHDTAAAKAMSDWLAVRQKVWTSAVPIVWAQSADTSTGALLRVLGGDTLHQDTSGIAAMLAEEDGLVRRVRLKFQRGASGSATSTIALAAVEACAEKHSACAIKTNIPSDTSSVALRSYVREPIFYTLGDALRAAKARDRATFASQVMVLGFVDGSDQVATPFGIRTGPSIVADAIETLMDDRGLIRRPPPWLGLGLDLFGALLVAALSFTLRDRPNVAALSTLGLTVGAYFGARFIMLAFNYWTSFLPIMVGVWAEQLVEQIREGTKRRRDSTALGTSQPATPAPPAPVPLSAAPPPPAIGAAASQPPAFRGAPPPTAPPSPPEAAKTTAVDPPAPSNPSAP